MLHVYDCHFGPHCSAHFPKLTLIVTGDMLHLLNPVSWWGVQFWVFLSDDPLTVCMVSTDVAELSPEMKQLHKVKLDFNKIHYKHLNRSDTNANSNSSIKKTLTPGEPLIHIHGCWSSCKPSYFTSKALIMSKWKYHLILEPYRPYC